MPKKAVVIEVSLAAAVFLLSVVLYDRTGHHPIVVGIGMLVAIALLADAG